MPENPKGYANPQLLVAPRDLAGEIESDDESLLILDVRTAEAFANGHLPGAVHIDLWGVSLIDTDPGPLRSFMWIIEHLFALRGVTNDHRIVVYEDTAGIKAARVFWFLEYFGHPNVRVLDGGFRAWTAAGLPVTTGARDPKPSNYQASPVAERLATWRDVSDRLGAKDTVILDTRSDGEYRGTIVRAKRGGKIPGAVHVEWTRNLDESGAFKPASELRQMYEAAGVTPDREVVSYCQGGYRAAHGYLALRLLGYPRVRNYTGSWKEWGDRQDLPIETSGSDL